MAPSVLGIGIPASSPLVPDHLKQQVKDALEAMEADMKASPYEWDFLDVDTDMDFGVVTQKLREKKWDVVMVGMGLRTGPNVTGLFEKIVNAVHEELPQTKFSFNTSIAGARKDINRVAPE